MGSTPDSTKLGLVGGATRLDVSKPKVLVATTAVSTTPGLSDALAGSDASWAPTATRSTPLPGFSVATLGVSTTSGLGGITDGSETSWDPTAPGPSPLKPEQLDRMLRLLSLRLQL